VSYNLGTASGQIRITYDSSGVARAVAGVDSLEAKLKALENASADINVDDTAARIKLEGIRAEIADLSKQVADPRVNIDEAAAQAKIAELTAELTKLDGDTVNVKVVPIPSPRSPTYSNSERACSRCYVLVSHSPQPWFLFSQRLLVARSLRLGRLGRLELALVRSSERSRLTCRTP
jgi:hypothetical protein